MKRRRVYDQGEANKRKKTHENGEWEETDSLLIFKDVNVKGSKKLATFDFDSTLVQTKSGRAFATKSSDWKLWHPKVKTKIKELYDDGYGIVIFSNQGGIKKGKLTIVELKKRLSGFMKEVNVPLQILCAIENDKNRKPSPGMWETFVQNYNGSITADKALSFYVGDAAGRRKFKSKAIGKPKTDHSCDDRKFALNAGIKFYTPDMFFLNEQPGKWELKGIDVKHMREVISRRKKYDAKTFVKQHQEMIINVGFPASGKSTFTKKVFVRAGYARINRDTLKTQSKCVKVTKEKLKDGISVVIDNTNPDIKSRDRYIEIAKTFGIPYRCFYFKTSKELANHLNVFREKVQGLKRVPRVAFNIYKSKFVHPSTDEGFTEVIEISFVPEFTDPKMEEIFYQYT